jgi:hypothetical protein
VVQTGWNMTGVRCNSYGSAVDIYATNSGKMALYVVVARIHCTVREICGFTLWVQPYGFNLMGPPSGFTLWV